MKTFYRGFIVLFFFSFVSNVRGQNKLNVELYGGFNKNYFQAGEPVANPDLQFSSPLGQHAGLNFLPRISDSWQMSVQTEWMRSAIRLDNPFSTGNNQSNNNGNYAIGVRYNLEREKHAFYFQPSVGISVNNYLEPMEGIFGFTSKRDIHFVARAEAGVKFYTKKRNYLLVGIRHQQGFASSNPYGSENWVGMPISGRNSYTGLFLGYGINTDNWSKSKRNLDKTPKPDMDNIWAKGIYVMGSASLRRVTDPIHDPTDDFQNVSTAYGFGVGYRFGDFSAEAGYAGFRGRNVYELSNSEGIPVSANHRRFIASTIPITIRYDRQLPISKKIRVGATFTTHIPVVFENGGEGVVNYAGARIMEGVTFPYEVQRTGLPVNSTGVFFNSGIYTEMPLFRTGLITFKASRNYGSPAFDRVQVDYQVSGVPGSLESQGRLNGWMLDVEYRLPLHHIFKK
ncbi:hypothetical protein [Pleomorphovibrio marinus]|uniref:hypothetical protein n=1 Tax=Pleomorphovibrio marinus TaxID=2164132 RepID=UPI000E0BABFA|nr:hypothetical protein [Pleomorphovibrio marinus]